MLGVGLGAVAVLCVALLPVDSPTWVAVARGSSLVAVLVFLWAAFRMPAGVGVVWWWFWAFQALTVAGDLVYDVQQYHFEVEPFPGVADLLYLASYLTVIIALVLLVRRRQRGRDRETWLDTAIITVAAFSVVAAVVLVPILPGSDTPLATIVSVAYPLLDVVVLSALIRLLVGGQRLNASLSLLAVSIAVLLVADLAFNSLVAAGIEVDAPAWVEALFLAAVVLLTAAATAPGADLIATPTARTHQTTGRIVGLAVGALTAPILLVFAVWGEGGWAARLLTVASIVVILLVLWRGLILMSVVERQSSQLADQARTDGLTGLPNRRTWDFHIERVAAQTDADGVALTVAILDLDHFKDYNDRHGHPVGDALLVGCARAWRSQLDPPAIIARYGGEEFAALLPGTGLADAHAVLERLRTATPGDQTVSIGYTQRDPSEPASQTVDRADRALYEAKAAGRDRLVSIEGSSSA